MQKLAEGVYAGVGENAIVLLLLTQAATVLWHMGKWIIDKYFREQEDKDAEVKKLKREFEGFRTDMLGAMRELTNEMKHIQKLPDEDEILKRLSDRMEFMVFKAARDLGIKDSKR